MIAHQNNRCCYKSPSNISSRSWLRIAQLSFSFSISSCSVNIIAMISYASVEMIISSSLSTSATLPEAIWKWKDKRECCDFFHADKDSTCWKGFFGRRKDDDLHLWRDGIFMFMDVMIVVNSLFLGLMTRKLQVVIKYDLKRDSEQFSSLANYPVSYLNTTLISSLISLNVNLRRARACCHPNLTFAQT